MGFVMVEVVKPAITDEAMGKNALSCFNFPVERKKFLLFEYTAKYIALEGAVPTK
jgi:hypothetical protein